MRAAVLTHRRGRDVGPPLDELRRFAAEQGVVLRFRPADADKHAISPGDGVEVDDDLHGGVDLCIVLGGDGTILAALREFAGSGIPVFAVNFGEVGFLATIDPDGLREGFALAFSGRYEPMELPGVTVGRPEGSWTAFNDVSVHRRHGFRVADLAYAIAGEEVGRVRCDGLVVATPAGSTGYNLANGGPVLAWGVEGYVVSFISPHSFTARALVVAPGDSLSIHNRSREEAVEVHVDGRPAFELPAGQEVGVEFARVHAILAQLPGATFYHRLRERFGRLAS